MADDGDIADIARGMQSLQRLRASRQVHGALMKAADTDLSLQAVQVLVALGDEQSVAELAAVARMDVGAVSRQLNVLEDEGLAVRSPSAVHGSVVIVRPTRAGRSLAARITRVRHEHLERALADWSPSDRRRLGQLLGRLVEDLLSTPYAAT